MVRREQRSAYLGRLLAQAASSFTFRPNGPIVHDAAGGRVSAANPRRALEATDGILAEPRVTAGQTEDRRTSPTSPAIDATADKTRKIPEFS